ncbi:MAG: UbiA prenyltransferase family protein [Flavobacteriales bacterium]|nr:UbiA prenyltransferase family protein [Flavobacteriales bacterium]
MNTLANQFKLLRPHQWVKNGFIFLPAFFAQALNTESAFQLVLGFISFSLLASSVYILNDLIDAPSDRLHQQKKERPIASGKVKPRNAIILGIVLAIIALTSAYFIHQQFLFASLFYLGMNVAYTFKLKQLALIDITIVSLGFLIRLYCGGVIAEVPISSWMYIMAFLLAMLLALGKRRDDLLILKNEGREVRQAIRGYNLAFVNVISVMLGAITVVAYIMYTLSPDIIARVGILTFI